MLIKRLGLVLLCLSLLALPTPAGAQEARLEFRQWAISATATSQYGESSWSAMQAAGEPDSFGCGDYLTAWASETSTGQDQLTLMYAQPVVPTGIRILQTYNPGAITGVELILADGSGTVAIPDSADPGTECGEAWHLDVPADIAPVNGVILTLDQTITGGWNEIDAVELIGTVAVGDPVELWASNAYATSQYGNTSWSALQVTGRADTPECGDNRTAWASESSTGQDRLTALFPYAVIASQVDIYQTYNPGAITGVDLILLDGSQAPLENSADPGTECPGVFSLNITEQQPVIGIVIHVDQTSLNDWNEIDAVKITGTLSGEWLRQWAATAEATSAYGEVEYGAMQATGRPDATECGDSSRAWASESSTGQDQLTVTFGTPVIPAEVTVYQTYAPGAITGIEFVLADGSGTVPVPDSADPNTDCPDVFRLPVPDGFAPVNGVIISVDQTITESWNEIDAVELAGQPVFE